MRFGVIAGRTRAASACMDLSDGLADAVRQLARASGTGAVIEAEALPIHPGAAEILSGESKPSPGGAGGPFRRPPSGGTVRRRGLRAAAGRFTSVAATFFGGPAAERRAGDPHRDADGGRRSGAAAGWRRRAAAGWIRAFRVAGRGENARKRGAHAQSSLTTGAFVAVEPGRQLLSLMASACGLLVSCLLC